MTDHSELAKAGIQSYLSELPSELEDAGWELDHWESEKPLGTYYPENIHATYRRLVDGKIHDSAFGAGHSAEVARGLALTEMKRRTPR